MRVFLSAILVACMSATSTLHAVSVRKADVSAKSVLLDSKQVPNEINYQGWLGNATDSAGFSGTPAMTFNLFATPTGGIASWSEIHMAVPVDKGIFHVLLGATTPLTTDLFSGAPLWLETIVGVDTLKPRKKIVSVAYAIRADSADKAYDSYLWDGNKWGDEYPKANKADTAAYALGGGGAAYADSAGHLVGPDVIRAKTTGYVLVLDNTSTGSGISVSATDKNAFHVADAGWCGLYVTDAGTQGMYVNSAGHCGVSVNNAGQDGFYIGTAGDNGFQVNNAADNGVYVGQADTHGVAIANAGRNGIDVAAARYGVFVDSVRYDGVYIKKAVDDGITVANAGDDGLYIIKAGDNGLYVAGAANNGVHINNATNYGIYAYGKYRGAHFESDTTGVRPTLYVKNRGGATDNERLAYFYGDANLAFYFLGNGYASADAGWNIHKKGGKSGVTPYHTIQSRDVEIVASGTSRLNNGSVTIALDSEINAFVSGNVDLKITATPKGSWSGLYVAQQSKGQFVVKSDAGDLNASFDWIVIAREKGFDVRTQFTAEQVQEILQPSEDVQEELQEQPEEQEQVRLSKQTDSGTIR